MTSAIPRTFGSPREVQWVLLEGLLPKANKRGRPRTPLRSILNATLYIVKSGWPWRLLPQTFPPWKTVYHHFRQWSLNNTWSALNDMLRTRVRASNGKRGNSAD